MMPPAGAGTRAIARKLCTGMNGLSQCRSHWPGLWGHVPQSNLASSPLAAELLEIYMVQQVISVLQENGIFRFGLVILSSIRY